MRILSTDVTGNNTAQSVAAILTGAGYSLPSPRAYNLIVSEKTGGSTNSRVGGADVSATKGQPLASLASTALFLSPVPRGQSLAFWDLTITYLYAATGDTVTITAWVD